MHQLSVDQRRDWSELSSYQHKIDWTKSQPNIVSLVKEDNVESTDVPLAPDNEKITNGAKNKGLLLKCEHRKAWLDCYQSNLYQQVPLNLYESL